MYLFFVVVAKFRVLTFTINWTPCMTKILVFPNFLMLIPIIDVALMNTKLNANFSIFGLKNKKMAKRIFICI